MYKESKSSLYELRAFGRACGKSEYFLKPEKNRPFKVSREWKPAQRWKKRRHILLYGLGVSES
jgi:hypothetical protein